MNFDDLKTSKYLAQKDVPDAGLDLTIGAFEMVTMKDNAQKVVLSFREPGVKPMIVNATNRNRLTSLCKTSETRNMIGHRVNVFPDTTVEMGGERVGGLRIRPCSVHAAGVVATVPPTAGIAPDALAAALALLQSRADAVTKPGPAGSDPFDQDVPF